MARRRGKKAPYRNRHVPGFHYVGNRLVPNEGTVYNEETEEWDLNPPESGPADHEVPVHHPPPQGSGGEGGADFDSGSEVTTHGIDEAGNATEETITTDNNGKVTKTFRTVDKDGNTIPDYYPETSTAVAVGDANPGGGHEGAGQTSGIKGSGGGSYHPGSTQGSSGGGAGGSGVGTDWHPGTTQGSGLGGIKGGGGGSGGGHEQPGQGSGDDWHEATSKDEYAGKGYAQRTKGYNPFLKIKKETKDKKGKFTRGSLRVRKPRRMAV